MQDNKAILKWYFTFCFLAFTLLAYTNCSQKGFNVASPPLTDEELASRAAGPEPFLKYQWHLKNDGQKVFATGLPTSGNDIRVAVPWAEGYLGTGVRVMVSDDGLESSHEDLAANFLSGPFSKNYTLASPYTANFSEPLTTADNHGTAVSGIIAAVGGNYKGVRGVAPNAKLAIANFVSDAVPVKDDAKLVDQSKGDFDLFNQSWGTDQQNITEITSTYKAQLLYGVTNHRQGLGSSYIKSAGNSFFVTSTRVANKYRLGNANFDSNNTTPYTINVAALAASPIAASYSSPGSAVWISAPAGEDGVTSPAILTTDRLGCGKGYSISNTSTNLSFQKGNDGNRYCNYTATFNGTSAAAPITSGVVALLLQVNPNLTWRDVKYLLAQSATQIDASISSFENPLYSIVSATDYADHKSPTGYVYEQAWITNAAGFKFHNWYGFGRLNAEAAIALAKSYSSTLGAAYDTNWNASHKKTGLSLSIPDYSSVGVTDTITMSTAMKIESVQLRVKITHANIGQLALELTSPSGTKSIVVNMNNSLDLISNYNNETLLTNAFYQESAVGTWTLKVIDGRTGTTGTLTEWSLNFVGGQ